MDNLNLISNFAEFKELKNIDKSTMIGVLEDVFRHALQKQYETDENFDVIINPEKGDLEIWRNRTVKFACLSKIISRNGGQTSCI